MSRASSRGRRRGEPVQVHRRGEGTPCGRPTVLGARSLAERLLYLDEAAICAALASAISGSHARGHETYGASRIHAELRATGQHASRKRVARLMRIADLVGGGRRPSPRTTIPDPAAQAQDLVKRDLRPTAPDRRWLADWSGRDYRMPWPRSSGGR
jgi:hypothetical protein